MKEAILEVLKNKLYDLSEYLQELERYADLYDFEIILGSFDTQIIIFEIEPYLYKLSILTEELIKFDKDYGYYCTLIDNELNFMLEFAGSIFLVGKIDIFTINREIISLIEVKTSKSEANYHSVQNKIYADLLNKVLGDKLDIKPLLWYPNPKNKRLKPKSPRWYKDKFEFIKRIKKNIKKANTLTYKDVELIKEQKWYPSIIRCKICGNKCVYVDELDLKEEKKLLTGKINDYF